MKSCEYIINNRCSLKNDACEYAYNTDICHINKLKS